jgi:hypothetical protein
MPLADRVPGRQPDDQRRQAEQGRAARLGSADADKGPWYFGDHASLKNIGSPAESVGD